MIKKIPSAGPWITNKEVEYVTDAVKNGWYENWFGYIDKFENSFANYIGAKYAISTSSCTGALHIILTALGIKKGDEVIVPEATWIATASSICYLGATPVFADIDRDTWCISVDDVREKITNKTKAILPVHNYGHPSDMEELCKIAHDKRIFIVEDAAPGIGSKIGDRLTGNFGDVSAFSFQGAKPLATGEGGMIVTDNKEIFDKCYYYWDHCRDSEKVLFNTEVGYKYKMSNIQAALGLAQLERIDDIIQKRRQIFFWYKERLELNNNFTLNVEREGYYNSFYVPTIILSENYNEEDRDRICNLLSERGVLNRPFWRPISKMVPRFEPADTPNADFICSRGINLPCATKLNEEDISYASTVINDVINGK